MLTYWLKNRNSHLFINIIQFMIFYSCYEPTFTKKAIINISNKSQKRVKSRGISRLNLNTPIRKIKYQVLQKNPNKTLHQNIVQPLFNTIPKYASENEQNKE